MAIDFHFDEQQQLIRNSAHEFFKKHCPLDLVRQAMDAEADVPPELWRGMADMGWLGILIPEEFGGLGAGFLDLYVLYPEFGRFLVPAPHLDVVMAADLVARLGTAAQKQALLPAIAAGEQVITLAVTGTGGYGMRDVTLGAARRGAGFVLDGTAVLVMAAGAADVLVCAAHVSGDTTDAVSLLLVPADAPGITRERMPSISGHPLYAVHFAGVELAAPALLGEAGRAWPVLEETLARAAILQAAMVSGAGDYLRDLSVDYALTRVQFGTPIGKHQAVQYLCSDIAMFQRQTALLALHAAWRVQTGRPFLREASLAKAMASKAAAHMPFCAHEVHAGIGFMADYPLQLYTRQAKHWETSFGDRRFHLERAAVLT